MSFDKNKPKMNAFEVDYWIRVLEEDHFSTRMLDEESKNALLELFDKTAIFEPVGDDDKKAFWICAERGTIAEFREYYDSDAGEEELIEAYNYYYPDEVCWYKFMSVHHCFRGEPFYGVFLGGKYVLSIGDVNEKGYPINAVEFITWLSEMTDETIEKCRNGKYDVWVRDSLPDKYKYGRIMRKDYWDIYPELRKEYRSCFSEKEIQRFLDIVSHDMSVQMKNQFTTRDFYEACAICYRSVEMKPQKCVFYNEDDSERQRYGNPTPKELYYTYADGRDNGMKNVPMDDPDAFSEWMDQKGPYYEFNGSHPWEIVPAGSLAFSIHLFVNKDRDGKGYCLSISGDQLHTSVETIHMFLALKDAGLPVILDDVSVLAGRFLETDHIGILPMNDRSFYGINIAGEYLRDTVNLSDGDRSNLVSQKAVWSPQEPLRIRMK